MGTSVTFINLLYILVVSTIDAFALRVKVDAAAIIVRLQTGLFMRHQLIYLAMVILGFAVMQLVFGLAAQALLLVVLLAQVLLAMLLQKRVSENHLSRNKALVKADMIKKKAVQRISHIL
jgi:hypothetical protein